MKKINITKYYPFLFLSLLLLLSLIIFTHNPVKAENIPPHGVIILYHHVAENTPPSTSISPEKFEAQMAYLEDNGFLVWPLPKLVEALQQKDAIPDKVVAITFDDNYQSVYTQAFSRLKQRGWPFTIFVSTDAVDMGINLQNSWDLLREMTKHGATIGNHSASHAHLLQHLPGENQRAWKRRIASDIKKAQRRIEEETGHKYKLLAYPFGEFNQELATLVSDMGFVGLGQHSGAADKNYAGLALPRFPFAGHYSELDDFALKIQTLPLPVKTISHTPGPLAFDHTQASMVLTLAPGDYDPKNMQCFGSGEGTLSMKWLERWQVKITSGKALPVGRSRFNCTLPFPNKRHNNERFYWFSQPWVKVTSDGNFLD